MLRNPEGLNMRESRFVDAYVIEPNATQAALLAGYGKQRAAKTGSRLLTYPHVAAAIEKRNAMLARAYEVTAERIIEEYARIGFSDHRDYMDWGPSGVKLKDSSGLTEAQARAVAEVSETRTKDGSTIRLKLHDKKGALDSLASRLWPTAKEQSPDGGGTYIQVNIGTVQQLRAVPLDELRRMVEVLDNGRLAAPG